MFQFSKRRFAFLTCLPPVDASVEPAPVADILPGLDVDVGEPLLEHEEKTSDERLKEIAASAEHQITHIPKNKFCSVCQKSKQDSLPARAVKVAHSLTDDEPSKAFGDRLHADHVIIAKGRLDKHLFGFRGERVCLIVVDDLTGFTLAYPSASKSASNCARDIRHFTGRRDAIELYSDNSKELESAADELKLVHPTTVPYRHTALINRHIRTIEDIARCAMCQAGQVKSLWPLALRYAATAISLDLPWQSLHGEPFPGLKFPFASLVFFRPQAKLTWKVALKTLPGIFLGWRIEPGCGFKRVYKVFSLEQVRDLLAGKVEVVPQTAMTVYQPPEGPAFPLMLARERSDLRLETKLEVPDEVVSEEIEGRVVELLPSPAPAESPPNMQFRITAARLHAFGETPGCLSCVDGTNRHSEECRARFAKHIADTVFEVPTGVDRAHDSWVLEGDTLTRYHIQPRVRLFAPGRVKSCPVGVESLIPHRETHVVFRSGKRESIITENWRGGDSSTTLEGEWTGKTVFFIKDEVPAAVAKAQPYLCSGKRAGNTKPAPLPKSAPPKIHEKSGYGRLYEFCCSENSNMGLLSESLGVQHVRLTKASGDMLNTDHVNQLLQQLAESEGVDLWGSLPCTPWTKWNAMNCKRLGAKFQEKLRARQAESCRLLRVFLAAARIVLRNHGRVHFEWPDSCSGWNLDELQQFIAEHGLHTAVCHGCAFGLPHRKPWRIVTSCERLAVALDAKRCMHPRDYKHVPIEGQYTANSAMYPRPMCSFVLQHLFPEKFHSKVPAMPCKTFVQHEHVPKEPEFPYVFSAIHQLIDRRAWVKDPAALAEAKKEAEGLLEEGTWNYDEVIPRNELLQQARESGRKIHVGQLMTIMSWKHAENPELKRLKARIVFRGDNVRDECGDYAIFQEIRVTPTSISGVNLNLLYGALSSHKTTQSDVVKAYVQSWLDTQHPTYVELPAELVPKEFAHLRRPCVRLFKSLYGHPESGGHWHRRFSQVAAELGGKESSTFPSSFWFERDKLLLTLYVDDMMLSGPSAAHSPFWDKVKRKLNIEEPADVSRVLGRDHKVQRSSTETVIDYDMTDFAKSACDTYLSLTGLTSFKPVPTPFLVDSALPEDGWEANGSLAGSAPRVLMKVLWLARLSRPDLLRPISELSRRITCWSANDDRRLHRLMSYVWTSAHFRMSNRVGDPGEALELVLYTDADHGGSFEHGYSTSGGLLVVSGPRTWFPVTWMSKRQTAVSRSTTEAETISLAQSFFSDALPTQEFLSMILQRPVVLRCKQDNTATIQVIRNGYSPKLRHVSKTHKLDLNGLYDAFASADVFLEYVSTDRQAADVFTKALPGPKWGPALSMLGITE